MGMRIVEWGPHLSLAITHLGVSPSISFQPNLPPIDIMKPGKCPGQTSIQLLSLLWGHAHYGSCVSEYPPLDIIHEVELGTDNRAIGTQEKWAWHWVAHSVEGGDHSELAINL